MDIQQFLPTETLASVGSNTLGLSNAEAQRRLQEYGQNQLQSAPADSLLNRLGREFFSFFSWILWAAAVLAFISDYMDPGHGMGKTGGALIVVILVSGLFSFWQRYRAEKILDALSKMLPQYVTALRDGNAVRIDTAVLVPGDIVLLEQGDSIPADCQLLETFQVRVDNSLLTGESVSQSRDTRISKTSDATFARSNLLAGATLVSGRAKAVVFATGMRTEFGKIAHLAQAAEPELSPLQHEIARFSRTIAILALSLGVTFFVVGWLAGIAFWQDFLFGIGVIIALVPEGLLPTLTLALVLAMQRLAKNQVLIRYLPAIETLGSTTVICTDKTGTLTLNRMQVRSLFLDRIIDVADPHATRTANRYRPFFDTAAYCHDLREAYNDNKRVWLGDPMEIALVDMANIFIADVPAPKRLHEIPFDSERKRLSIVCSSVEGTTLYIKGAPETLLSCCNRFLLNGEPTHLDTTQRQRIVAAQNTMAAEGLRVLALAYRPLKDEIGSDVFVDKHSLEQECIFTGLVGFEDPPRPEVPSAIAQCRSAGIKIIMVTGDYPLTAVAIAHKIGLIHSEHPTVITGKQLQKLSLTQLQIALDSPDIIFARIAPEQKMQIVTALKNKRHIVAVTGDGVNDAPALRAAHIGIAMGRSGTDVAKQSAEMVLLDDNFASIVYAIKEGRAVFDNIRKFVTYIFVHDVAELIPYLAYMLLRVPLALTPIQALMIDMGTDSLTALGLGVEKPDAKVMQRPPRPQSDRLLNRSLVWRAFGLLGLTEAGLSMSAFFFVLLGAGWKYPQSLAPDDPLYWQATTACLSAIIVLQIVNVFLCRSSFQSVFVTGWRGNTLILWGVGLELVFLLMAIYSPWGAKFLATQALRGDHWLFILPLGLVLLALDELRKWFIRKRLLGAAS